MSGVETFQNHGNRSKLEKAGGGSNPPWVWMAGQLFGEAPAAPAWNQRLQAYTHLGTSEHLEAYPCF